MTIAMLKTDAFTEFKWNEKSQRYTIRSGAGRSKFISKQAFLSRLDAHITTQKQALVGLADRLSSGAIGLEEFQRGAAKLVNDLHSSAALTHGVENLTATEYKLVVNRIKEQLYTGKDWETGGSYGIRSLARDVKSGKTSASRLRARLTAYSEAGRLTANEVGLSIAKRQGNIYGVRRLGNGEHCPECPGLQQLTPAPIEQLTLPGQNCSCRSRCLCTITSMNITEAVQAGMKDPRPAEKRKRELERIQQRGFGLRRRRDAVRIS